MSYMTISSQENHHFSLCSYFHAHPITLLLKILGGPMHGPSPKSPKVSAPALDDSKSGSIFHKAHIPPQASTELTCHAPMVCIEYQLGREAGSAAADRQAGRQIARQINKQINRHTAA